MSTAASAIPEDSALLCEGCGYILTGLAPESRCPECAKPIAESSPLLRIDPAWEHDDGSNEWRRFRATTFAVLFHTSTFFRTLSTRSETSRSAVFARWHYRLASVLFALAGTLHVFWLSGSTSTEPSVIGVPILFFLVCYTSLRSIVSLAARLTAWEAAYRGLRLPLRTVRRGLDYHAAHYLPVALLALLTVGGYQLLLQFGLLTGLSATRYVYVLCAEVILAAGYLFVTYWKGMRNLLFANA